MAKVVYVGPGWRALGGLAEIVDVGDPGMVEADLAVVDRRVGPEELQQYLESFRALGIPAVVAAADIDAVTSAMIDAKLASGFVYRNAGDEQLRQTFGIIFADLGIEVEEATGGEE